MTTLLETVHGSHLYRLAHEGSDVDTYRVIDGFRGARPNRVRHTVDREAGTDVTVVGLSTFMHLCEEGVPQALEAMFSPVAVVDRMAELRSAYRVGWTTRRTYMRTAKNFINGDTEKKQRHACRLLLNLDVALRYGRFDPVLSNVQLTLLDKWKSSYHELYEEILTW